MNYTSHIMTFKLRHIEHHKCYPCSQNYQSVEVFEAEGRSETKEGRLTTYPSAGGWMVRVSYSLTPECLLVKGVAS